MAMNQRSVVSCFSPHRKRLDQHYVCQLGVTSLETSVACRLVKELVDLPLEEPKMRRKSDVSGQEGAQQRIVIAESK